MLCHNTYYHINVTNTHFYEHDIIFLFISFYCPLLYTYPDQEHHFYVDDICVWNYMTRLMSPIFIDMQT